MGILKFICGILIPHKPSQWAALDIRPSHDIIYRKEVCRCERCGKELTRDNAW